MNRKRFKRAHAALVIVVMTFGVLGADSASLGGEQASSYSPVDIKEAFADTTHEGSEGEGHATAEGFTGGAL